MMAEMVTHYDAYTWGNNCFGCRGIGNYEAVNHLTKITVGNITWTQVACGCHHSIALSSNGEVFTWGHGIDGVLGLGDCVDRNVPTKVQYLSKERIVKVACGDDHSAALTSTGKLFTWYVLCDTF